MNRGQLFNEAWSMMSQNRALWIVALIGLGIGTIVQWVVSSPNLGSSILTALVNFAVTAFTTGALVMMVNVIANGQSVTVSDGIQAGTRWLIPLLLVQVILALPVWIVLILATGSFLSIFSQLGQPGSLRATDLSGFVGAVSGIVIVALLLGLITSAIGVGANRAVVLENMPVTQALQRGWQLLTRKLGDFIAIGVRMLIIALAIGIVVGCATSVLALPLVGPALDEMGAGTGNFDPSRAASSLTAGTVIFTIIGLLIGAGFEVLFSSVWTLAFRQWQREQL